MHPGPNLNLVVGPNGSGKSTNVSALCLGLGGDPGTLGRTADLQEFIKHAKTDASIEITLSGGGDEDDVVLTRTWQVEHLHSKRNHSVHYIDGRKVKASEYTYTLSQFDIQVKNLTQFLPQDRVSQFAALSPSDLLKETEKAVGQEALLRAHERLVSHVKQERELSSHIEEITEIHAGLKAQNEALHRDVTRIQARDRKRQKATQLRAHARWLEVDEAHRELEVSKQRLKDLRMQLAQAAAVSENSVASTTAQAAQKNRDDSRAAAEQHWKGFDQGRRAYNKFLDAHSEPWTQFNATEAAHADVGAGVLAAREKVATATRLLNTAREAKNDNLTVEDLNARIAEVNASLEDKAVQEKELAARRTAAQKESKKATARYDNLKIEREELLKATEAQVESLVKLDSTITWAKAELGQVVQCVHGRRVRPSGCALPCLRGSLGPGR